VSCGWKKAAMYDFEISSTKNAMGYNGYRKNILVSQVVQVGKPEPVLKSNID
jgi:hypothetical protein